MSRVSKGKLRFIKRLYWSKIKRANALKVLDKIKGVRLKGFSTRITGNTHYSGCRKINHDPNIEKVFSINPFKTPIYKKLTPGKHFS